METIEKLLEKLALYGGKIVSTASLSPYEIEVARSEGRMYVDNGHLGYVWIKPLVIDKTTLWKTIEAFTADPISEETIKRAVDLFLREQAIEFAKWVAEETNPFLYHGKENGRWIQASGNSTSWSSEQLYQLFIEAGLALQAGTKQETNERT